MWILAGIGAYYIERTFDDENGEPMSMTAAICMGFIGFLMVIAQIGRGRE